MGEWTYALCGRPGMPEQMESGMDEPGTVVMAERRDEPGACDLYVLIGQDARCRTATYSWHIGGTPEEIVAAIPKAIGVPDTFRG